MTFKNSILIVAFNYSAHLHHIPFFLKYYKPHFKKILFYSDLQVNDSVTENHLVHYINIKMGYTLHNIFTHFINTYKHEIEAIDGLFYTMDDAIINVNLLHTLSPEKIVYDYHIPADITHYNDSQWYWWQTVYGRSAVHSLLNDTKASDISPKVFSRGFSDYFYLPRRYLTEELFEKFELFAKHEVFLEIAIPTIISTMEPNKEIYNDYSQCVLWNNDRLKIRNKDWFSAQFHDKLIIHPIKFGENEEYKEWIYEATRNRKCVIITTINPPTKQCLSYINIHGWDLIVVADTKTDVEKWAGIDCIFLSMDKQREIAPELFDKVPTRSYTRKMFGYVYAYKNGYTAIYDTDDDNVFKGGLICPTVTNAHKVVTSAGFNNIYNLFTDKHIWPRGIPPGHPSINEYPIVAQKESMPCAVIQGLVDNDPDVDAYYRINVSDKPFVFEKIHDDVALERFAVCPFNTQNTFWLDRAEWYHMYLPITVTFRYTDILRGVISLYQLWRNNKTLLFTGATAIQERNVHDLQKDLEQEQPMYDTIIQVIGLLTANPAATLMDVYKKLCDIGIVTEAELSCLQTWLSYFN